MSDQPTKRKKCHYSSDGTKIVDSQTLRRRKKDFNSALTAELLDLMNDSSDEESRQECNDSHMYDSHPNPRGNEKEMASPSADIDELITSSENGRNNISLCNPREISTIKFHDEAPYHEIAESLDSSDDENIGSEIVPAPLLESVLPALTEEVHSSQTSPNPTILSSSQSDIDSDPDSFNANKLKDYILSGGDTVMFKEANLKTWQVILIILGICTRFSLSAKARRALIEATKVFAGPQFSTWDISDYYLSKIFDTPEGVIVYHFYCQVCYQQLEKLTTKVTFENHDVVCEKCLHKYTLSMNSPNYFISIDLKYQITSLLSMTVLKDSFLKNLKNINSAVRTDGFIRDVYDGLLYKKLVAETPKNSQLLTYVFNTDGAPLFHSSKRSFWPILLVLNELPPDVRFRYPLLAGLCIVRKEPSADMMNTYMKSFVEQANKLNTEGFNVRIDGKDIRFVLKPLVCSVDSVARPLLQNRLQFNGYYGCSWCYSMGVHKHGCMRFLMEENEPPERTHGDYVEDVKAAEKKRQSFQSKKRMKKSNVRGVKGNATLTELHGLDMVWAFFRDYLHADLIGVVSQLWSMWCDFQCPIHLDKAQQDKVNERLMNMTPPHEIHRLVRPLKTEKCKWKASEWRSWLLFYSVPCLQGILNYNALQHFALYVDSIYTLLQIRISQEELNTVQYNLHKFVMTFEILYGERYVTFNIHSLKHLVRCITYCGPLWATSTFTFENAIYYLKRYVHGPKGVYEQMARKSVQANVFHSLVLEMEQSPSCLAFYHLLFGRSEVASFCRSGEVVLIGKGYLDPNYQFVSQTASRILTFQRCIFSHMVIHCVTYNRPRKSNDTVFVLRNGKFVQILNLLCGDGIALAEVSCFKVTKILLSCVDKECANNCPDIENLEINHLFEVDGHGNDEIIAVTDLHEKCVVINVDGKMYISKIPNRIEIQ